MFVADDVCRIMMFVAYKVCLSIKKFVWFKSNNLDIDPSHTLLYVFCASILGIS